jgi:hypothetical protein
MKYSSMEMVLKSRFMSFVILRKRSGRSKYQCTQMDASLTLSREEWLMI